MSSASPVSDIVVTSLDGEQALAAVDALADVLIDCVEGGASVSFMLPLTRERATAFWRKVADGVARGERVLLVARRAADTTGGGGICGISGIVGTVQLILDLPENQPHRADVAKMLVHRSVRRQGVAQRLMAALDDAARAHARHVLVLDTVTGGDAERLYQRSGWQRAGDVPKFALMPDGEYCATTFYYKHL
ncbi:N-acetyltransferase [Pandoraea sp. ISTKB]|uniref:GNAT family N-acetyltransferase n=1 Tax=Pandoraea sp. ISTKB TaxID=1586708 RepID=UPI000847A8E0|nr:GNAT family N-acetyltransferase [Pandoraea sp. ISTKB]ODP31824.1 acetyltransferase [Pandoraea sp. ISTKB]